MYTVVKKRTRFIHVACRETTNVYIYVGAPFFQFFLAVDFIRNILRTVPTIVTAHTFCASRDTRVSYGWWLLIQGYFCAV